MANIVGAEPSLSNCVEADINDWVSMGRTPTTMANIVDAGRDNDHLTQM